MKPMNTTQRVLLCLIATITLVIWAQSLLPANQSLDQSDAVGSWLAALLGDGPIGRFLVENIREVAHFVEFGALGLVWGLFAYARLPQPGNWPLIPGIATAVVDELLQLGSVGRAVQLTDVLLDSAGYIAGWLAIIIIVHLWRLCRKKTCNF